MDTERTQVGWRFWLWWVLASTVGFAVGRVVPILMTIGMAVGGAAGRDASWVAALDAWI